ncbi:MAG TPA: lytic transglycosylase domain-containing protein, partial [Spirochaetia bacterium]|nr:lytic transglycosylase domain-containing protein [Spirochaetia bacterium]
MIIASISAALATDCQGTAPVVSPAPEALPAVATLPPPVMPVRDATIEEPGPDATSSPSPQQGLPPVNEPLAPLQGLRAEELYSLEMPDQAVVSAYLIGLLTSQREWLQAALENSIPYRLAISRAIAERGLPREIQFLPAVESGFQPRAVSPQGATGLWQLMRNTASPYGLRMDPWIDERKDFLKATAASLQKLQENYDQFGDWYLALAAYNCGAGRLSAILRRYPHADFWTLRRKAALPRETAA